MRLLLLALLLLAACSTAATPEADSALIATGIAATQSAELGSAPTLLAPIDGAMVANPAEVVLDWEWTRPLQANEVYDVRVWRGDAPHFGITWAQSSRFALSEWLRFQEPGEFFWSIAVIVGGEDGQIERTLSQEAAAFSFTVQDTTLPTPTPIPLASVVQVPPGFEARLYAQDARATLPTAITFGPDDRLYMLTQGGDIFRFSDSDGGHHAETSERIFLDAPDLLQHAVGMAFDADGALYISHSGSISTFSDEDADGLLDTLTPITEGLVSLRYPFHSNNGIAFSPVDGKLYVSVGSTSDHGPLRNPQEAAILRLNPDGTEREIFASGLRNAFDLTFSPEGDLFTADNNPDTLDDALTYLPPEEVNHIRAGRNYGFPDFFGIPPADSASEAPVVELFPSVATSGLTYYAAEQFPAEFRDGVYVALFGTAAPVPQERNLTNGRMVVFVSLEPTGDGTFSGAWQPFATFNQQRDFRPIDVTVGPDGALYIAEWTTAAIYRIEWVGAGAQQVAIAPTPTAEPNPELNSQLVQQGADIFRNGAQGAPACAACHTLDGVSSIGPSLLGLGRVANQRVPGLDSDAYIRESITDPNAYIVPGYSAGFMFQDYAARLTADQLDALVAYVRSLGESG